MSRLFLSRTKTLIHRSNSFAVASSSNRSFSSLPVTSGVVSNTVSEHEARVVEKIEDAIHGIIVKKSRPDWLEFVPGASYWVPPRPESYGISEIVHNLVNKRTHEEHLSVVSMRGLPSPAFYFNNDDGGSFSHTDSATDDETSTIEISLHEEAT